MRASSPVRQLASLGAVALVGLSALVLRTGVVEAGPGAGAPLLWLASGAPGDSARTADSLRAVRALAAGDTTLADSLFAALRASAPGAAPAGAPVATSLEALSPEALAALPRLAGRPAARADTDTVIVATPDSLSPPVLSPGELAELLAVADSAAADTARTDTTRRALEYLPGTPRARTGVALVPQRLPGIRGRLGSYYQREVTLDSTEYAYTVREEVGGEDVRAPALLTFDEFVAAQRRAALADGFRSLAAQRADRGRRRAGVGFTVDIPGGEQSAFRTLFGKNEVDLTVNGTSNVNLGLGYNTNELRTGLGGQRGTFAPDFGQELNLNVAGTIGDKLRINVNYDTQSAFEFENQVSLVYTGYEDDIVQRIEAGNVFLQTPAELIQGGQRLFGLRTDLRFGPLAVTAVASQQDAQTNEQVIEGGSESTPFAIAPTEYENDTHFFLGYAFHNYWDSLHRQPGQKLLPPGFQQLIGIEVWKHEPNLQNTTVNTTDEIITATALADLGEPGGGPATAGVAPLRQGGLNVLLGGEEYLAAVLARTNDPLRTQLPDPTIDVYADSDLELIRANNSLDIDQRFNLKPGGSASGRYRRLRENVDYTVDPQLGWLSLTQGLNENDFLAVAYTYRDATGAIVTIGDFGQGTLDINRRTVLKLLRGDLPAPAAPLWDLTMRNVYRIGGRSLNPSAFDLRITYEASGNAPLEIFPDVAIGNQQTLLQTLGLDRVNEQGQPTPDNEFDFQLGLTVNPESGRIIFPVRQPFGDYLTQVLTTGRTLSGETVNVAPTTGTVADAAARYAFEPLYDLKPVQARQQFPALSRYRIGGEFRSATQSVFNVGFNLVEGTVRATSGGVNLTENTDYRVNYSAGTLEIINPSLLQNGQQVRIQVEQQRLFNIGSTTLIGLRADYRLAENTTFGGTLMRLSQRPSGIDKYRLGEEPFNNTIAGLDGRYLAEPRWITRALDFLPLIQTRAPSRVEIRGEVARLTPGHPNTIAFDQTVRRLALAGDAYTLPSDERGGDVSFIDDFEGSESAFGELGDAPGWRLAAPPEGAGPAGAVSSTGLVNPDEATNPLFRSNWRGLFSWYSVSRNAYEEYLEGLITPATAPIQAIDLFPDRFANGRGTTASAARTFLPLLDLYFDPSRRGPYNYNRDLATTVAADPRTVWGGMIRPIPGAYSDFQGQNNIEFVEMLVAADGGRDGTEAIQAGARMYLDLGRMNEDVVPNGVTSTEDGLRTSGAPLPSELDAFGRRTQGQTNGVVDFNAETGRTEDVGLDGLPSSVNLVVEGGQNYAVSEQTYFTAFLDAARSFPAGQRRIAEEDPSFDDFHHFGDDSWFENPERFPGGASLQERYSQYFPAVELNSNRARTEIVRSDLGGLGTQPNTEDINGNLTVDFSEVYHRYEVPLDAAGLQASPFFENTVVIQSGAATGQTFYLLRIPVRTENRVTSPGLDRDDFSRIEAVRVWTTGHDRPATLRMASFQLVGSRWLASERVGLTAADNAGQMPPGPDPRLFVASINNEESPTTYAIPRQAIYRSSGQASSTGELGRDKSLVLRTETLADGRTAAVTRSYATNPFDLTRYSNVRMYVHGHGFERSDSLRVVVRLGDDETENYYEYEQPVFPFELADARLLDSVERADSLWQTITPTRPDRNSVNIVLSELNKLKVSRDEAGVPLDAVFRSSTAPVDAPPGARIAIRGQPSIQDVRTIVLGVRNGVGGRVAPLDTVEVWFNELRVSGYDEEQGASGFMTANVVLADVGTVTARFSQTQDGFGALGGGLGEREFADRTAVSLTSSFNAHRLLPERFGWSIPVSYSLTANEATPRYDPRRGDIRLSELVERAQSDVTAAGPGATALQISPEEIVERAQTVTGTRNFRIQASKANSRSPYLKYTIDGLTAAYTATAQTARNPSSAVNDADSWAANLAYRVAVPRPKTVRPFWFTGGVPLANVLSGLRLNVLPQTVSFATDARRSLSLTRSRLDEAFFAEPDSVRQFRNLARRTQLFDHGRQFDTQYNPFPFLQLSYGSNTDQDLGGAGQNEAFRIFVRDSTGRGREFLVSPTAARDSGSVVRQFFGLDDSAAAFNNLTVLGGQELDILPFAETVSGIFSGDRSVRTRGYNQSLTAALRLSLARVKWLSWIRPQALSYQTSYQWTNQPIANQPDLVVAGAGTRVQLQTGLQIAPTEFWRLFPFYRSLAASAGRGPRGGAQPAPARAVPDSSAGRRFFRPGAIGRDVFLAATGLTDISVTYRGAFTSSVGGLVGDSYSLLSGIRGVAPSVGYRLGLSRTVPIERRLADPTVGLQYSDQLQDRHTLEARSTVEPIRALRVGLTWQTTFDESERLPYTYTPNPDDPLNAFVTPGVVERRGSGQSTVYSFGGSYENLLARHQQRLRDDLEGTSADGEFTSEYLLRTGLAADFQSEFARGLGGFGPRGLFAIPVPGWDITYSGLSNFPILRSLTQQITLRHNYSATSEAAYSSFYTADPARTVTLGTGDNAQTARLVSPGVDPSAGSSEANAVTVNERYQPVVGASIGFKGGIQADVTYNKSNLYTLQTTSNTLTEKSIQDLTVNFSFAKTGLRLLGLRRLNNNVRLSLQASLATDQTFLRNIRTDLNDILQRGEFIPVEPVALRRLQLSPRMSYTVSNQVTADFFVRYEKTDSQSSTTPGTSSFDGGVSLRILFSN